jgi:hypothetical protein
MKRLLFALVMVLFVVSEPRAQVIKKAGVTWWWQRTDAGVLVNVDVEDPDVIEVRAWATGDGGMMASSAAMVYGVGLPAAVGMVWPKDANPNRIWVEVVKAVGLENNPAEKQLYTAGTDPAAVSEKFN